MIRPTTGNDTYNVVIRFDTLEHLNAWTDSPERHRLVEEIKSSLADDDKVQVHTETAFWFTPERRKPGNSMPVTHGTRLVLGKITSRVIRNCFHCGGRFTVARD